MGRGMSPLGAVARGSSKDASQENMDPNSCAGVGDLAMRKPLASISEACRNSDENGLIAPPSKGKKRGGQFPLPHAENVEGSLGTPEKQGISNVKKSRNRHPSPAKNQHALRLQDASPAEPGVDVPSCDLAHSTVGVVFKGHADQHGALKQGSENVNSHTPTLRGHRGDRGGKHGSDSEPASSVRPNYSQNVSATPAKSVTRTLKYGAPQGGTAGVPLTSRAVVPLPGGGRHVSQGATEQQFSLEEDPSFWVDRNVQVLIRTRPISSTEAVSQGFSRCLRQESPHTLTWLGPPETRFTFDHVAGELISQEKLFNVAGLPMVENCMGGYNSCMFAYGQTGSGKTHTMLGDIEHLGDRPSDNRGMTPRVFEYLFLRIQLEEQRRKDENLKFLTKVSFLEIYNEQITDLLEPSSTNLQMREDVRKGVYVENLTEVEVNSVQDVIQLLSQGSANRKVAATNMNRESSRSHSVFTCIIESRWESEAMSNIRFGRLNLVDLAGSERQKTSGAEGERLKEAANINKSLSTLGLVIMILVDVANGKQRHVPYRDSKLTFLLQDSLGGNSKTTIIAAVSPANCNALETLSTLKFAQRAKLIRNTAVVNEDASGDVKALRAQIQQLKEELDRLRRQSISRVPLSQDDFNPIRGSFDSWGDAHKFFAGVGSFGSPRVSTRKLRLMDELQEEVEIAKPEVPSSEDSSRSSFVKALETENSKHLELIAELKLQLEESAEKLKIQESVCEQLDAQLKDALLESQSLRSELEATLDVLAAARSLTEKLQSKEAALVSSQYAEAVKQIRVETEQMAAQQSQSLTNIQEMAVLFRMKEAELRSQLDDAQRIIEELSAQGEERKSCGGCAQSNSVRTEDGSFERLQKAQEIEMRHAEEVMQLQLELESLEAVLDEERGQKKDLEERLSQLEMAGLPPPDCAMEEVSSSRDRKSSAEKSLPSDFEVAKLTQQLQEAEETISKLRAAGEVRETTYFDAVSRLQLYSPDRRDCTRLSEQRDYEKSVMEALKFQQLYSIQEFELLRGEHLKLSETLRRRAERERMFRRKVELLEYELMKEQEIRGLEQKLTGLDDGGDPGRDVLVIKLENAKRELAFANTEYLKFKEEESEIDLTQTDGETDADQDVRSMHSEVARSVLALEAPDPARKKLFVEEENVENDFSEVIREFQSRSEHADAAFEKLVREKEEIQSELKSRDSLLLELQARIDEADAALETVTGEKAVLESRVERITADANLAASRLWEAEEAQSVLQERVTAMEARIVEYAEKERAWTMEIEELYTARNMSEEDVIQLQNEVVELRRERDSLNLEVSTMDAQSAISERLQFIQSMCVDTDNQISSMQSEIDDLTSAKGKLESEVRSIEGKTAQLVQELVEKEESLEVARRDLERMQSELLGAAADRSAPREELAAADLMRQTGQESMDSMTKTIDELKKSRANKEEEYVVLEERLERARVNRMQAQEKLDVLTVAMQEFSTCEKSWRNERGRMVSEMETMKSEMAEMGAEVVALKEEKLILESRLQVVAAERDVALAAVASLEGRSEIVKPAGKDTCSGSDRIDLSEAQRKSSVVEEEKVNLFADRKSTTMVVREKSKLNTIRELLQSEISRPEDPYAPVLDRNNSASKDAGSGKERIMDELKQVVKRTDENYEKLRSKLRERDDLKQMAKKTAAFKHSIMGMFQNL